MVDFARWVVAAGLEPTYEGLKRLEPGASCVVVQSLEPTYEGLKLLEREAVKAIRACLEPTYEGLKLSGGSTRYGSTTTFGAYL